MAANDSCLNREQLIRIADRLQSIVNDLRQVMAESRLRDDDILALIRQSGLPQIVCNLLPIDVQQKLVRSGVAGLSEREVEQMISAWREA